MLRRIALTSAAACALITSLITMNSGASTASPLIFAQTLSDAAHQTSMTVSGSFSGSGVSAVVKLEAAPNGSSTFETIAGVGTEDIVVPSSGSPCFVKASSIGILSQALEIRKPTSAEIGVWYKVSKTDSRFDFIANPGGAQTIAQMYSFSPIGWSRSATDKGATVLKGAKVVKLLGASNLWVDGKGFGNVDLFVTETSHPLPFAISGPSGTSGLLYFKWGSTKVSIPVTNANLPH